LPPYEEVALLRILEAHNVAFCVHNFDQEGVPYVTSNFVYLRLRGPEKKFRLSYSEGALVSWADTIEDWRLSGRDVFVHFSNLRRGTAVIDSHRLAELLARKAASEFVPFKELRIPPEAGY
jgi:uncharacterized protein YecE (DUF72 family)